MTRSREIDRQFQRGLITDDALRAGRRRLAEDHNPVRPDDEEPREDGPVTMMTASAPGGTRANRPARRDGGPMADLRADHRRPRPEQLPVGMTVRVLHSTHGARKGPPTPPSDGRPGHLTRRPSTWPRRHHP
jgi:hypothetical protein